MIDQNKREFDIVTGPGRSGAIAAVYVSHMTGKPFAPYGHSIPENLRVLVVDTAVMTGATMRKAVRRYEKNRAFGLYCYCEPPRVKFWYEVLRGNT